MVALSVASAKRQKVRAHEFLNFEVLPRYVKGQWPQVGRLARRNFQEQKNIFYVKFQTGDRARPIVHDPLRRKLAGNSNWHSAVGDVYRVYQRFPSGKHQPS